MANMDENEQGKREGAEIFAQLLEEFVAAIVADRMSSINSDADDESRGLHEAITLNECRKAFVEACIKISV